MKKFDVRYHQERVRFEKSIGVGNHLVGKRPADDEDRKDAMEISMWGLNQHSNMSSKGLTKIQLNSKLPDRGGGKWTRLKDATVQFPAVHMTLSLDELTSDSGLERAADPETTPVESSRSQASQDRQTLPPSILSRIRPPTTERSDDHNLSFVQPSATYIVPGATLTVPTFTLDQPSSSPGEGSSSSPSSPTPSYNTSREPSPSLGTISSADYCRKRRQSIDDFLERGRARSRTRKD